MLLQSLFFIPTAFAQTAAGLNAVANAAGIAGGNTDLFTIIGRIINIVLGFVGVILLGIFLYSGFEWMTSGGDPKKVDSAKTRLRNAVVGLIIIMSAFAIVNFILNALLGATGGGGGGVGGSGAGGGAGGGFPGSSGSLGGGIIESHIPARDATGVPRNTAIVVTFKEPIKVSSIIKDYTEATSSTTTGLNSDAVKIYVNGQRDHALTTAQARVRVTSDHKTFVIKPVDYLGSATANTDYTVELAGGSTAGGSVLLEDGTAAFGGAFASGYKWQFEVSTVVDLTPPHVTTVIPQAGGHFAPNIVVQVNFDEPVDPTSAAGIWHAGSGFTNMLVSATPVAGGATSRPNGEFKISNQYRTVEFVSDLACGTNSCGRTVYCLPTDNSVAVEVLSPSLSDTPPQAALTASGYDGVVDMAGNALDGNGDGIAQGSAADAVAGDDRYGWTFGTAGAPNLTPPNIKTTSPTAGDLTDSSNLAVDRKPTATFDSMLQSSTVNTDNVLMTSNESAAMADTFWWSTSQEALNASGAPAAIGDAAVSGRVSVNHRIFLPATSTAAVPVYQTSFKSGLQNVYQNCYNPASSDACHASAANPNCCNGRTQAGGCTAPHSP
jgi:hypothetical protein